jgi:O-antigen ligase
LFSKILLTTISELRLNFSTVALFIAFILNVNIAAISNYTSNSYLLKIIAGGILLITLIPFSKRLKELLWIGKREILVLILILFSIIISIFYSLNPYFGFKKALNILITLPLLLAAFIVLLEQSHSVLLKTFLFVTIIFSFISILGFLIINPFQYESPYSFSILRWSHVIFGRFAAICFVIFLVLYIRSGKDYLLLLGILLLIILVLSGFRAGIIGAVIFPIALFFYKKQYKNLIGFSVTVIFAFILYGFANGFNFERFLPLFNIFKTEIGDGAIISRIEAYRAGFELFQEHYLFGAGLGGYNFNSVGAIQEAIKYPHNIFIEVMSEFGLAGLTIFLLYVVYCFRILKKADNLLLIIWLFSFWLALFSKDLSTNPLLFLPTSFYFFKQYGMTNVPGDGHVELK